MKTISSNPEVDEVMLEVRRIKEELARKFDFDVRRMGEDAMERQWKSGHEVISRAKSQVTQTN